LAYNHLLSAIARFTDFIIADLAKSVKKNHSSGFIGFSCGVFALTFRGV